MKELLDLILANGLSVVIVAYFIVKDWYQTKNTYEILTELKGLLNEFKVMLTEFEKKN